MRTLILVALLVMAVPTLAQEKILFFPVLNEGQSNFVWALQLKTGAEFWYYHGSTGTRAEVILPQLVEKDRFGRMSAGLYLRFDDQIRRIGLAGSLSLGNPKGWQVAGPYYAYLQRSGCNFDVPAFWVPNLRLTYPVSQNLRLGLGGALVATEGKQPTLVLGPYTQWRLSKSSNLQIRIGRFLSPTAQAGQWQLFSGVTTQF